MSSQDLDKEQGIRKKGSLIKHWQPSQPQYQQPQSQWPQQPQQLQQPQSQQPQQPQSHQPQQPQSQQPQQSQPQTLLQWPRQPQQFQFQWPQPPQSQWPQQPQQSQPQWPQPPLPQWPQQPQQPQQNQQRQWPHHEYQWSQSPSQQPQQYLPQLPPQPPQQIDDEEKIDDLKKIADEFGLILPDYINFMTEKYRKSQSPISTITSLESSPATSPHSPLRSPPLKSRTPMDNFEQQLINNNLELPSQYFTRERHYPRSPSPRPNANVSDKYTEPKTSREYSQKQMSEILENNYSSLPKWILDIIYVELRALFLRTRHLDHSSRNSMIEDIISKLFSHFSKKKENKQKISFMGKRFRKVFDGWRSELWSNIGFTYQNSCTNDNISQLKSKVSVSTIFRQWLTCVSNELSEEMERALQNVIIYGIRCLSEEVDDDKTARRNFFMANTDLYTINLDFACTDKIDVTRSMELSHYYISAARSFPEDDDEKNDNDEREQRKHKKKVTKKIEN
ncbi:zona pellucida sperm-binding protein 4-like [Rhizophagus clarus]|uniref:Zona pellucida sperm-binding protein 4-like n=1 Tax=Rhizophagus clarus TaxID=94130 RepID=A0A8H3QM06_9GLOM|nr:zona pellucida sperm-binding protein 4-like [Rhizophagus clarus]